jgi:hypothetical protein
MSLTMAATALAVWPFPAAGLRTGLCRLGAVLAVFGLAIVIAIAIDLDSGASRGHSPIGPGLWLTFFGFLLLLTGALIGPPGPPRLPGLPPPRR